MNDNNYEDVTAVLESWETACSMMCVLYVNMKAVLCVLLWSLEYTVSVAAVTSVDIGVYRVQRTAGEHLPTSYVCSL